MLNWITSEIENKIVHSISVTETSEKFVRHIIESSADKAINSLKRNIQDDSLYLLFEWNMDEAKLTIVVTNASKTHDAPESICCIFSSLAIELSRESDAQRYDYIESVKFWLHDYLTTCSAFFSYSLVAIFHSSSRNNTELL
jgi:hypothetical protein